MNEYDYYFKRDLKFHICNKCKNSDNLEWYDKLYDDVYCKKCGKSASRIPYETYIKQTQKDIYNKT